ncbi:ABC transporter permease [Methylolobus aquaticus]|nr:ABC transporter permease [Methylolobus aquaticus]
MLSAIAAIAVKELRLLWRDRQALALLFLMPAFFILVMSVALEGVFDAGTRSHPLQILIVNQDRGEAAHDTLEQARALEGVTLIEAGPNGAWTRDDAEAAIRQGRFHFALLFGPDYSDRIAGIETGTAAAPSSEGNLHRSNETVALALIVDPAINRQLQTMVAGTLTGVIERVRLGTQLPARFEEAFDSEADDLPPPTVGDPSAAPPDPADEVAEVLGDDAQRVELELLPPSGFDRARRPSATEQNVPAYAIFGVFFIVLTIAKSFLREKLDGTFVRLLTAPVRKSVLIIGKLMPYLLVNLLQIALMFAVGAAVFGMHLGNLPAFVLLSFGTAAAANGLGLLVAALGHSEAQVDTLAVLLAITLAALGGIMVPTFVMPEGLQQLSRLTPHAWALSGYQDVIVRGLGVSDILPETAVLLGFASIFWLVGLWRLRLN